MLLDDVTKRLSTIGYAIVESDTWVLEFIIKKVEDDIKNECNTVAIPESLYQNIVDIATGEFLFMKKNSGQLTGFNLDTAVKQITEGDTSVVYAIGDASKSPEQRLETLIQYLMNNGKERFTAFRCIRW
jgi:hypothetical protein